MRIVLLFLLAGLGLRAQSSRASQVLFASDFCRTGTNGWKNVGLFKGPTSYTTSRDGTNCFIYAQADNSCSALTMKLDCKPPKKLVLRWRWRIDGVNTNGSEHDLKRFDHAARVFVAFDTFIGPPRTLNYFWANSEPVGSFFDHPMTSRAQIIVVESGNSKAGRWVSEERDVTADWQHAFGSKKMPKIEAVGMLTDGDSLETKISGDYADIELIAE
jgi:hypothetical protein